VGLSTDDIAAVLVTRGDGLDGVDLAPILSALPFPVVVWDNQRRPFNAKVFGRYLAILETDRPVIFTQDDDAIVHCIPELIAHYEPGKIVAAMKKGHRPGEPPMLGWGALFDRDLPWRAFERWLQRWPLDWQMTGYPETIFTALTPCVRLDFDGGGHEDLPWSSGPTRSHHQPQHYDEFALVLERASALAEGKLSVREVYMSALGERLAAFSEGRSSEPWAR